MDFLLVYSTPPLRLLWLHHSVRILVGRWSSELRATFLILYRISVNQLYPLCSLGNFPVLRASSPPDDI